MQYFLSFIQNGKRKDWINLKFPLVVFFDVIMLIIMLFYKKIHRLQIWISYVFNNFNNNWNYQKEIEVQLLFISTEYFKMSYEIIN